MFQFSQGKHTTQGHKGIPEAHFEEEQGRKGFFGPVSHLIKPQPSTRWSKIDGPLKPHLYDLVELPKAYGLWKRIMYNGDIGLYKLCLQKSSLVGQSAFRNADGDTLYFVHKGAGQVLTEYGLLEFRAGSYINIPKCVTHTLLCDDESDFLVIESRGSMFEEPNRGMVGRNAFYDPAAIGKPNLDLLSMQLKRLTTPVVEITVKRADEATRFEYTENIYDTVGWKGDFFPFTLHIDDLMPMLSARVHLPPSAHTTFVAKNFVVCTFLPRPLESDADALKVPFYHQNIDYDEVLFYHDGNFFSRDNLHAGMMTLHPAGFPHGPHPKAVKNVGAKTHTDEVAVMIDTYNHLLVDQQMDAIELKNYWQSWMAK
jgi:homogentisate 1,2-dioxygenase